MEFNPFTEPSNFVDLLSSQQNVVFGNVPESQLPFFASQDTHDSNIGEETQGSRKERRTWSPTDDIVLISLWLNTSKDAVVGNEQRFIAFWKRIAAYYNASPKLVGCEKREAAHSEGSSKKRKSVDVSHSASSKSIDVDSGDEATTRLPGVKASKARSKKPIGDAKDYDEFQSMWSMKKEDLTIKKELSKIKLLETLIGRE
ncbi:PREDICTED: uncharacterized protein LOC106303262 [Brassica oleracea var. oleracea]|uniref:uncharacterized protein LOC106303262 n=1 Tax=Brassica oleracea var. oleracea TaxID=109376 RepID=UPI0006A7267C|nr:PREDICTED: uncharacterized protein LOC106303262 [Brassica oleracea var. oleracea]